jgi:hypothetical protein
METIREDVTNAVAMAQLELTHSEAAKADTYNYKLIESYRSDPVELGEWPGDAR